MAKFYIRHLNKQTRTIQAIKTKRPKKSSGWSQLAKGRNRARIFEKKLNDLLKQPAFAQYKEEFRGYARDKYNQQTILYNKNGKLNEFKKDHTSDKYMSKRDLDRFNKYYNKVKSGKYSETKKQDFYVRGLMNKKALQNKKLNLKQFKIQSKGKVKLTAKERARFGISATEYDSETLASKHGFTYAQVQELGRKKRNGEIDDLTPDELALTQAFESGEWDAEREAIRREREANQLYGGNNGNGKD